MVHIKLLEKKGHSYAPRFLEIIFGAIGIVECCWPSTYFWCFVRFRGEVQVGIARSQPLIRGDGRKCKEKLADKVCPKLLLDN